MVIRNRNILIMRIGILSFDQKANEKIYRFTSGTIAAAYCKAGTHVKISKKVIRELTPNVTESSKPERLFIRPKYGVDVINIPELPYTGPQTTLVLSYPLADQSSYAERDFKLTWGCSPEEWRKKIGAHEPSQME